MLFQKLVLFQQPAALQRHRPIWNAAAMSGERRVLRVGTRGSALALRQTEMICAAMTQRLPHLRFEIVKIVTHGDRFQQKPIVEMGAEVEKGIFNTALEDAVLDGRVDFSTCSFKDVQSELRPGLQAVSVGPREDHRDVLVSRHRLPLARLPQGAVLATSSPRRVSQLKAFRPDFRFVALRGNVTTRVESEAARHDGVILAAAGLIRLGLEDHIQETLDEAVLLPAPAQGAMGCEFLAGNALAAEAVAAIQHPATQLCVSLEKALLMRLSGGCFAPIGVLARVEHGALRLRCRIASLDGTRVAAAEKTAPPADADKLLERVLEDVSGQGGLEIVREVRDALLLES